MLVPVCGCICTEAQACRGNHRRTKEKYPSFHKISFLMRFTRLFFQRSNVSNESFDIVIAQFPAERLHGGLAVFFDTFFD